MFSSRIKNKDLVFALAIVFRLYETSEAFKICATAKLETIQYNRTIFITIFTKIKNKNIYKSNEIP